MPARENSLVEMVVLLDGVSGNRGGRCTVISLCSIATLCLSARRLEHLGSVLFLFLFSICVSLYFCLFLLLSPLFSLLSHSISLSLNISHLGLSSIISYCTFVWCETHTDMHLQSYGIANNLCFFCHQLVKHLYLTNHLGFQFAIAMHLKSITEPKIPVDLHQNQKRQLDMRNILGCLVIFHRHLSQSPAQLDNTYTAMCVCGCIPFWSGKVKLSVYIPYQCLRAFIL